MVRIRLRRVGAKKQPSYRVVIADSRAPRDGRFIENIGFYNPRTDPATVRIKEDRALYWLSQGAQPSDPVKHLLGKQGTLERLARLRAGESLEALVAEFEAGPEEETEEAVAEGAEAPQEAAAPKEPVAEKVVEAPQEAEAEEEAETEEEPEAPEEAEAEEEPEAPEEAEAEEKPEAPEEAEVEKEAETSKEAEAEKETETPEEETKEDDDEPPAKEAEA